jgi:hypothetical protein
MAETADVGMSGGPPAGEGSGRQATQAAGQARARLREQVDQRSTQAGQQVSSQAGELRSLGVQLRRQGKEGPAKLADQVADRTEQVGRWLTRSDADAILDDVEDFARRNPWALAAGGMVLGLAASRLLKASSTQRYQARRASGTTRTPAGALVPQATTGPPVPPAHAMPVPAPSSPIGAP